MPGRRACGSAGAGSLGKSVPAEVGEAGREVEFFLAAKDILDLGFGITYVSYNRYIH